MVSTPLLNSPKSTLAWWSVCPIFPRIVPIQTQQRQIRHPDSTLNQFVDWSITRGRTRVITPSWWPPWFPWYQILRNRPGVNYWRSISHQFRIPPSQRISRAIYHGTVQYLLRLGNGTWFPTVGPRPRMHPTYYSIPILRSWRTCWVRSTRPLPKTPLVIVPAPLFWTMDWARTVPPRQWRTRPWPPWPEHYSTPWPIRPHCRPIWASRRATERRPSLETTILQRRPCQSEWPIDSYPWVIARQRRTNSTRVHHPVRHWHWPAIRPRPRSPPRPALSSWIGPIPIQRHLDASISIDWRTVQCPFRIGKRQSPIRPVFRWYVFPKWPRIHWGPWTCRRPRIPKWVTSWLVDTAG